MSKASHRRAQQMLARWPEHWPQKPDYVARHVPARPPADGLPLDQIAATYRQIARTVAIKLSQLSLDHSSKFPNIVIQNT